MRCFSVVDVVVVDQPSHIRFGKLVLLTPKRQDEGQDENHENEYLLHGGSPCGNVVIWRLGSLTRVEGQRTLD